MPPTPPLTPGLDCFFGQLFLVSLKRVISPNVLLPFHRGRPSSPPRPPHDLRTPLRRFAAATPTLLRLNFEQATSFHRSLPQSFFSLGCLRFTNTDSSRTPKHISSVPSFVTQMPHFCRRDYDQEPHSPVRQKVLSPPAAALPVMKLPLAYPITVCLPGLGKVAVTLPLSHFAKGEEIFMHLFSAAFQISAGVYYF